MLCSGRCHQLEEISEVANLLKAWKEEWDKERECYGYEEQRAADRARYEELIHILTDRRPRRVEANPQSLILTKLTEGDRSTPDNLQESSGGSQGREG